VPARARGDPGERLDQREKDEGNDRRHVVVADFVRVGPGGDQVQRELRAQREEHRSGQGEESHRNEQPQKVLAVRGGEETGQQVVGPGQVEDGVRQAGGKGPVEAIGEDVPARAQPGEDEAHQDGHVHQGPGHEDRPQAPPSPEDGVEAERRHRGRDVLDGEEGKQREERGLAIPVLPHRLGGRQEAGDGEVDRLVVLEPGVLKGRVGEVRQEHDECRERAQLPPGDPVEKPSGGRERGGLHHHQQPRVTKGPEERRQGSDEEVDPGRVLPEQVEPVDRHQGRFAPGEPPHSLGEDRQIELERVEVGEAIQVGAGVESGRRGQQAVGRHVCTGRSGRRLGRDGRGYGSPSGAVNRLLVLS
jgi:hypothetical protein